MKKNNVQCLILCVLACLMYGLCQNDWILAGATLALIIPSFIFYILNIRSDFPFLKIPWTATIIIAIILGSLWRLFIMPSNYVHDLLSFLIAILQSSMLFMFLLSWCRPESENRSYYLQFQSWTAVALAINIYMTGIQLIIFCIFCIVGLTFFLYNSNKISQDEKSSPLKTHNWSFYIFPIGVFVLTLVLSIIISVTILITDRTFMHLINDYNTQIDPNHFLKMNSFMNLTGPGKSGNDIRPVMTMSRKNEPGAYLITQIFDHYEQGVWKIRKDAVKKLLPEINPNHQRILNITMFTSFANIVPAPKTVIAMEGKGEFFSNAGDIVYASHLSRTRKIRLAGSNSRLSFQDPNTIGKNYLQIPEPLRNSLKQFTYKKFGTHTDPYVFTTLVQEYFQNNFKYTLNVKYKGDDEGIMNMLNNTRPAYCTYFASAMALILRAEGIPSRIVTGFLVTEKIGKKENEFLVRVRDGHAWVEALVPNEEGRHIWKRFDPTPGGERKEAIDKSKPLLNLADKIWIWSMRMQANLQELEWTDFKKPLLILLITIILLFAYQRKKSSEKENEIIIHKPKIENNSTTAELRKFYEQLVSYIQGTYQFQRRPYETNRDFLQRLFKTTAIPSNTALHITDIYKQYSAARFGHYNSKNLEKALIKLKT